MSGNEASAIGSLRAINSGQTTFASSCAGGGYAQTPRRPRQRPRAASAFISPDLGARRHGDQERLHVSMTGTARDRQHGLQRRREAGLRLPRLG